MEKKLPQKIYWAQATLIFFYKKISIIVWFQKYFSLNGKKIASKTLSGTTHIDFFFKNLNFFNFLVSNFFSLNGKKNCFKNIIGHKAH